MGQSGGTAKPESNATLQSRYVAQEVQLGKGCFGTVWRAVDRQSGSFVAVKQLDKVSFLRTGTKDRDIDREIAMMKACDSEHVLRFFERFEDTKNIWLVLEYCDEGALAARIKEWGTDIGEGSVAAWTRQMAIALDVLHVKGICHRDVKPENFLFARSRNPGYGSILKLIDFGMAVYLPPGQLLTSRCGTPAFMSPEVFQLPSGRGYGLTADIWALGVCMYMAMNAGRHPFLDSFERISLAALTAGTLDFSEPRTLGRNFFSFNESAPTSCRFSELARQLCQRMVQPDVAKRSTARAVIRDSEVLLQQRGVRAGYPGDDASALAPTLLPRAGAPPFALAGCKKMAHPAEYGKMPAGFAAADCGNMPRSVAAADCGKVHSAVGGRSGDALESKAPCRGFGRQPSANAAAAEGRRGHDGVSKEIDQKYGRALTDPVHSHRIMTHPAFFGGAQRLNFVAQRSL